MSPPSVPRYSARAFPSYRHRPGRTHHPVQDSRGHSAGLPPETISHAELETWWTSEPFRFGVDLFNHAYWWEAHEAWEVIWKGLPPGPDKHVIRALIQLSAALLKAAVGQPEGAAKLVDRARAELTAAAPHPTDRPGFNVTALLTNVETSAATNTPPPTIQLNTPPPSTLN